jgi:hypothetical protein
VPMPRTDPLGVRAQDPELTNGGQACPHRLQADCKPEFTSLPEEFTARHRSAVDHDRISGSGRGGSGESGRDANGHTTSTAAPTTRHQHRIQDSTGSSISRIVDRRRDRCRAVGIGDDAELATQTRVGAEHDRTRATRRCGSRGSPWTRPTGR